MDKEPDNTVYEYGDDCECGAPLEWTVYPHYLFGDTDLATCFECGREYAEGQMIRGPDDEI